MVIDGRFVDIMLQKILTVNDMGLLGISWNNGNRMCLHWIACYFNVFKEYFYVKGELQNATYLKGIKGWCMVFKWETKDMVIYKGVWWCGLLAADTDLGANFVMVKFGIEAWISF